MWVHPGIPIVRVVQTDSLQHVTATPDCRRDAIGPNTLKERPETERRFLSLQKKICTINLKEQISRHLGAEGRTLRCINCARQ
jgi:hypothetical protein